MSDVFIGKHIIKLIELMQRDSNPLDHLVSSYFRNHRYLGSKDRRELSESIYGIVRNLRCLQAIIAKLKTDCISNPAWLFAAYKIHIAKIPIDKLSGYMMPISMFELSELSEIKLDENCDIDIKYSFPAWLYESLKSQIGYFETMLLLEEMNHNSPLTIRTNDLKTSQNQCLVQLKQMGFNCKPCQYSPSGIHLAKRTNLFLIDLFKNGHFELQDEGSQIISLLLDPKSNWKIADVCAGGGGKTLHLSALMKNRGEIFAFDVEPKRLENLKKRAIRNGVKNVRICLINNNDISSYIEKFDGVLIDAPCSGTGVLRRNPDAKWKITYEMIKESALKQKQILNLYSKFVKKGGRLVYATCSLLCEENESIVESFLKENKNYLLDDASYVLEHYKIGNLVDKSTNKGYLRLFPHKHGCDGFFAALMIKKGSLETRGGGKVKIKDNKIMIALFKNWANKYFSDPQVVILYVILVFGFLVIFIIGDMLTPVFTSIVIAYLLDGIASNLTRYKIPRMVSVVTVFLLSIAAFIVLTIGLMPMLSKQIGQFLNELPQMIIRGKNLIIHLSEKYSDYISDSQIEHILSAINYEITNLGQRILSLSLASMKGLITLVIYTILVPFLVFFFLKDKQQILEWFTNFLPEQRGLTTEVWKEVNKEISNYVRGKIWEFLIIWGITYIVFMILGLNFAMLVAFLNGLSIFIPYVGSVLFLIPLTLISYFQWGLSSQFSYPIIAYIIIHALDANLMAPLLFSEVVNLHPVAIIVAILFFGGLWGLWGVFFAIPLATLVHAVIKAWRKQKLKNDLT